MPSCGATSRSRHLGTATVIDPVERDTNRHLNAESNFESWYERNEADLVEGYLERYGVEPDTSTVKWATFCDDQYAMYRFAGREFEAD